MITVMANVNFKLISLNARGIRDSWLQRQNAEIAFLEETYSTRDVVDKWRFQWPRKFFYSHGTIAKEVSNLTGPSSGQGWSLYFD